MSTNVTRISASGCQLPGKDPLAFASQSEGRTCVQVNGMEREISASGKEIYKYQIEQFIVWARNHSDVTFFLM